MDEEDDFQEYEEETPEAPVEPEPFFMAKPRIFRVAARTCKVRIPCGLTVKLKKGEPVDGLTEDEEERLECLGFMKEEM